MLDLSTEQVFKPLKNSRKPEIYGWLFFAIITIILSIVPNSGFLRIAGLILAGFFLFSGAAMTLGNWMNRNTILMMSDSGINFENGIQKVNFGWENIHRVEVHSRRVNDKIIVVGEDGHKFGIDMFNELFLNNKSGGVVGFREGEKILETILYYSDIDSSRKLQAEGYYYYEK